MPTSPQGPEPPPLRTESRGPARFNLSGLRRDQIISHPSTDHHHPASLDDAALLAQCRVTRSRGSGPGGQHRNKVETAIVLHHEPTGISGQASERRSQKDNQRAALSRLRLNLATGHRTDPPAEPSPLWRSRLQGSRLVINPTHRDYPALLAEALDAIAAYDHEVAAAAEHLRCSTSQLIKLLKHHPPALEQVNQARAANGQHALK